jgi:hypothetical protein
LLELLRGLRQRVELSRVQTRRNKEVAGALGARRREDGSLQIEEAPIGHLLPDAGDDGGTQQDVAMHPLAAQVEEAVGEPGLLIHLLFGEDTERQRVAAAQHLDLADLNLDLTRRQLRINVLCQALQYTPVGADDGLLGQAAQRLVGR